MRVSASAPGRVNLIGEHTDYNAGFVLPFALPFRTTVTATPTGLDEWTVTSDWSPGGVTRFDRPQAAPGSASWVDYVRGVIWSLQEEGHEIPCADLHISSDVPVGSGLSSSAALECAVLTALVELGGLDIPTEDLPRIAQRAENDFVGVPCGIMDQSASILARAGHALLLDCRTLETEHIPFDATILVIDTKAPHRLVDGEYAQRRATCEAAARELLVPALRDADLSDVDRLSDPVMRRRARHVVSENARVLETVALLAAGRVHEIGPLMTDSHTSLKNDFEVTVPELDVAVAAALEAGAYGARMTGGGFGGCVIALVEPRDVAFVTESVESAFARSKFTPPHAFVAAPSAGAHLEK
ncbi:galactokinase [Longispora sp. K20-0274]|uniref:galactokinase n=1 Tax=Longispora sp. K20-0274 TaxID=3088255 RepID=UPI00399BC6AE